MVHAISPLQCPNQQEVSPEFPSQEISCAEALTAQTKSSPGPHRSCRGGQGSGQTGVGVNRVEGGGGLRGGRMGQCGGEQRSCFTSVGLGFVRKLLTNWHMLAFTSWLAASSQASLNLEREDLMGG